MGVVTKRRIQITGGVAYVLAMLAVALAVATADFDLALWVVLPLLLVSGGCYLSCVRG